MPITEILEKNAKEYGKDVCLVEINPDLPGKEKSNMERLRITRSNPCVSIEEKLLARI